MTEKTLSFSKMHGLGNDFVVLDTRGADYRLDVDTIRRMADRHRGIGFDQLAVIAAGEDLHLSFYNADGSEAGACGNATRCVAAREMALTGQDNLQIETSRGALQATRNSDGMICINMGQPLTDWRSIPLLDDIDTLHLPIDGDPVATSMGNPHCTFFVADIDKIDLPKAGCAIECHPLFPEGTNVQFAQIIDDQTIRMRVWERGVGVTLASGSSSCATVVAAVRRGLTSRTVKVHLDGGSLDINWAEDGVWMAGPTAHVFDGTLLDSWLGA